MEGRNDIRTLVLADAARIGPAVRRIAEAIRAAREAGDRRLLVIVPADLGQPTLAQRVEMVRLWADAAQGRVRVAVVAPEGMLDRERVGIVAATGFGLDGDAFTDEAAARDWLLMR